MDSKTLLSLIDESRDTLDSYFSESYINKIKTEEIKTQMTRFGIGKVRPILNDFEHAKEVIKSPVHIGLLGRYSHGKTALANALFSMKEECCLLPEGDGVVTSKVTYISFEDVFAPEVYEVKKGSGESSIISLEQLQSCVGKSDIDTSAVDYYKMVLPAEKNFAKLFMKKRINLVDMPGLGGPYFKDQTTTRKYMRELDMVIAVIRIDDIEDAGRNIDSLLDSLSVPVIPVLTFADLWESCDIYADCKNIEDAIFKAKALIKQYIPSIVKSADNAIAVSSVTGLNINEMRSLILENIETSNIAIGKARKDISPVYRRQLQGFRNEFLQLKEKLADLSENLEELLKPIVPEYSGKKSDILADALNQTHVRRAERALFDQADKGVNEIFDRFESRAIQLSNLSMGADLETEAKKVISETNKRFVRDYKENLARNFELYKDELLQAINVGLNKMELDSKTKSNLVEEMDKLMSSQELKFKDEIDVKEDNAAIAKVMTSFRGREAANFIAGLWKHKSAFVLVALGIIISGSLLATAGWFALLGLVLTVAGIATYLIEVPQENKRFFQEAKDDMANALVGMFDVNAKKDEVSNFLKQCLGDMKQDIGDILKEGQKSYNDDASFLKMVKDNIDDSLRSLTGKLDDEVSAISAQR